MPYDPVSDDYEDRIILPELAFLSDYLLYFNEFMEAFCVIFNCFHLMVLLRKPLRTNSVFIIMIEICIFEQIYFLQLRLVRLLDMDFSVKDAACLREPLYAISLFGESWKVLSTISRRMFVWLMVQLALIRTLSISFPMSDWLMKTRTTLVCSLGIFLFWVTLQHWPIVTVRAYWKPDTLQIEACRTYPPSMNANNPVYVFAYPNFVAFRYRISWEQKEDIIRMITVVIYIFLVVILIVKLRLINRKRQKMNSSEKSSDNTTALILTMTVTFLIAEASGALLILFDFWSESRSSGRWILFGKVQNNGAEMITRSLRVLNSAFHAVICYFMSSQYRDTVHKILCQERKIKTLAVIPSTTSVSRNGHKKMAKNSWTD